MPKVKKTVTVDSNLVAWVEKQMGKKEFASLSHAIEKSLTRLKAEYDKKEDEG
jgi:Arc/MetJ-type ribon-helix-helix transcriptional regulator